MKTIIVTGGAGFIGCNLCRRLINENNRVICVDNFDTGSMSNIEDITSSNFRVIEHDVINPLKIDEEIDQIYNLASPASPEHFQARPIETIQTNVWGTFNMLRLSLEHGARLLEASTSEVYGNPLKHPQNESYWGNVNPNGVRSCYDEGKRCAESLCVNFDREFGARIKIIRIFNTYGPYLNPTDGRVVTNFIMQALNNEDITVHGDGLQTRSFCYVDDLVEGIIRMMNSPEDFKGPVNLGNPHEITMIELAHLIVEKTGSESEIVHCPSREDDPVQRRPDIGLANRKLGWKPEIKLEEGLERTIEYYKSTL